MDLWVQGQPGLQSEFQDSQGSVERSCLKKQVSQVVTVLHTFNPNTQEAKEKHGYEFKASLVYTEKI